MKQTSGRRFFSVEKKSVTLYLHIYDYANSDRVCEYFNHIVNLYITL